MVGLVRILLCSCLLIATMQSVLAAPKTSAKAENKVVAELGPRPEECQLDEEYLLGVYAGNGSIVLVLERKGQLFLAHRTEEEDRDYSHSAIFPLTKQYYDCYSVGDVPKAAAVGDTAKFERDQEGNGVALRLDDNIYNRKYQFGEHAKVFKVKVVRPWPELEKEAKAALLPKQRATKQATLVDLSQVVPRLHYDLRYATTNNCFGHPLVPVAKAYLDQEAATALIKAQEALRMRGYGLLVWEAYRPWQAFKLATLALPDKEKRILPKAEEGYPHDTGRSIDVSLYDLATGQPVQMICDFDVPTAAQFSAYVGGTGLERWQRDVLRQAMLAAGFTASKDEWWHFDYPSQEKYQMLNIPLQELK